MVAGIGSGHPWPSGLRPPSAPKTSFLTFCEPAFVLGSFQYQPIKNPSPFGLRFVIGGGGGNCT